jgi:feruloyl esterase
VIRALFGLVGLALTAAGAANAQETRGIGPIVACADLARMNFAGIPDAPTSILSANLVASTPEAPSHCRVRGNIAPHVGFELRLPVDNWNGKLFMQGCRAYCGVIMIDEANDALKRGYVTVATDMGHSGTILDAVWAYNNRDAEIDYGFRATHVTAVAAKAILRAFHGVNATQSYFRGCSTGGRQGLVEAQRFPADFDGIIAGAPVAPKDGALNFYWSAKSNLNDNWRGILASEQVYLIRAAVMKKCDAKDGLIDGILEDPRECDFDPAELRCGGITSGDLLRRSDCLSEAQVDAARKLYSGPTKSDGTHVTPGGHMPGGELNWLGTVVSSDGGAGQYLKLAEDNFRFLAFAEDPGPSYTLDQFNLDTDTDRMNFMLHFTTGFNPDLKAFRDRGGRMIIYQGWQDGPALNIVDYFETATETMGGPEAMADVARLFMVPGMDHCSGGAGVNSFDFITAIEQWVELGKAPDNILGTHREPAGNETFSRPVYPYPDFARYDGSKDRISADGFKRQSPRKE